MSLVVLLVAAAALCALLWAGRPRAAPLPRAMEGGATTLLLCGPCRPGFVEAARGRAAWPHMLQVVALEDGCAAAVPGVRRAGRLPPRGVAVLAHASRADLVAHWDKRAHAVVEEASLWSHGLQPRDDAVSQLLALPLWRAAYPGGEEADCPDYRLVFGAAPALQRVAGAWFDSPWAAPALAWACAACGLALRRAAVPVAAAVRPLEVRPMSAADACTLRARLVSAAAAGTPPPLSPGRALEIVLRPSEGRAADGA